MTHRRLVLLTALLSACGRTGYERVSTAGDSGSADSDTTLADTDPTPARSFAFDQNPCVAAESGPFVEVARYPTTQPAYGLSFKDATLVVGNTASGLQTVTFDGAVFAAADSIAAADIGWVEAVWTDGLLHYVGAPGRGASVVEIDATGAMTLLGTNTDVSEARHLMGDGTYVYVPNGNGGLQATQLVDTALEAVGTAWTPGLFVTGASARDGRIVVAADTAVVALAFDGSAFSVSALVDGLDGAQRVWVRDTTVFVIDNEALRVYTLGATALTPVTQAPLSARGREVWSDGVHVFVAAGVGGLYAFAFDGAALSELDHVVQESDEALGVIGDGTYVYLSYGDVVAYSGFACTDF